MRKKLLVEDMKSLESLGESIYEAQNEKIKKRKEKNSPPLGLDSDTDLDIVFCVFLIIILSLDIKKTVLPQLQSFISHTSLQTIIRTSRHETM